MRSWTVHLRDDRPAVLVPERFSLAAMLFGPLWLLLHGAWIPAILVACAWVLVGVVFPPPVAVVLQFGLAWFTGLSGHDLRRWSLARRRFCLAHVVAARSADAALARLFEADPALIAAEAAR